MWEMLPLQCGKKQTENRRDRSFSPVKPFSILRKCVQAAVFLYAGWFFSNVLLTDPSAYYSPIFRALAVFLIIAGIAFSISLIRQPGPGVFWIMTGMLVLFHVRLMLVDVVRVQGTSMQPALQDGDFIVIERWSSGLHLPPLDFPFTLFQKVDPGPPWSRTLFAKAPEIGDLVVFDFPERRTAGRFYIKRVVARSGQHYHFTEHMLFIDGEPLLNQKGEIAVIEPYPDRHQTPVMEVPARLLELDPVFAYSSMNGIGLSGYVPEGGLLVIGDSYRESRDSRVIGFIPISAVQGRRWGDLVF
jgi:signal peptidase I